MSGGSSKSERLALRAGLYISQFLGVGFFFTALSGILREHGASLGQLGILNTLLLIAIAKIAWAPLVDRFGSRRGHYRSWLLPMQAGMTAVFAVLLLLDPVEDLPAVLALAALHLILSSTQDTAADALAVRLEDTASQPHAAGIAIAASYLGSAVGGGGSLLVYDAFGWVPAVAVLGLITAATVVQAARLHEPDRPSGPRPSAAAMLRAFPDLLRPRGAKHWALLILPLMWISASTVLGLLPVLFIDSGWSLSRLALVNTVIGGAAAIGGALLMSTCLSRWGHRRCMLILTALQTAGYAALAIIGESAPLTLGAAALVVAVTAGYAMNAAAVDSVCMMYSRPEWAATDYSTFSAFAGGLATVTSSAALLAAGRFGYPPVLWTGTAIAALAAVAIAVLYTDAPPRAAEPGGAQEIAEPESADSPEAFSPAPQTARYRDGVMP